MAKRKKTTPVVSDAEIIDSIVELVSEDMLSEIDNVPAPAPDFLSLLKEFRERKAKSAELTDDARDKFAVKAIDEFLESLDAQGKQSS